MVAVSKDSSEYLVIELKKGRPSDSVVGQIQRYMGYIKNTLVKNNEDVKGCIIATHEDQNLKNAISMVNNIDFYKYELNFSLDKVNF